MNAAVKAKINKIACLVAASAALCVGLGALHINVLGALHLEGFEQMLRYLVGIAGLTALVIYFKDCSMGKCGA